MRPGPRSILTLFLGLAAGLAGALVVALLPGVAAAAPQATTLSLSAPATYSYHDTTVTLVLRTAEGPVAAGEVVVERARGDGWEALAGPLTTDENGTATFPVRVSKSVSRNRIRARYAGDETHAKAERTYTVPLKAHPTTVTVTGRTSVVDERYLYLGLTWRTTDDRPVNGVVALQRYLDGRWRTYRDYRTYSDGYVRVRLRPRVDTRYRAVGRPMAWAAKDISGTHRVDNLPPGIRVKLPAGAPRPRVSLPRQPRATGAGPNPAISRIPNGVWRSMVGRSWHRGCPVGRSGLRLLRINYWDYSGYRRRGEIVAAASVVRQMAGALSDMYRAKLPMRSMYRVDRFGWSRRLQGADDYRSMAAGNTSAFNCRWVVGRPGVRSPHSYGRSLDVNPWENPYRSSHGWVPNAWWPSRSHDRVAWRSRSHRVVRIMADNGLRWTYGRSDLHHFDAVPRGGRLIVVPGCADTVCH
ncbi:M15 family metallopeptidase [Nocardioides sp. SYSU DS0651]|uniref:M15 family metallopeptidase n=1 Tax=Nocardioides sp. SYSU DS0651 TaxID=3415955 RepID=UPI003F4BF9CD